MFPMYFEGILIGTVLARVSIYVYSRINEPGYSFRKTMVLMFVGIYSFGRCYELFTISAYHEEQGQAVAGMACAMVVYGLGRLINESAFGRAMRKVLYWMMVGDLKTDVKKC